MCYLTFISSVHLHLCSALAPEQTVNAFLLTSFFIVEFYYVLRFDIFLSFETIQKRLSTLKNMEENFSGSLSLQAFTWAVQ